MGTVPPSLKQKFKGKAIEKAILRSAFDLDSYLPDSVLWRQKEQFSDGVGYSWINELKAWTSKQVSDSDFERASEIYPVNTPASKEAMYYRRRFEEMFPNPAVLTTVKLWVPRLDWGCSYDPSGRAQKNHEQAYKKID